MMAGRGPESDSWTRLGPRALLLPALALSLALGSGAEAEDAAKPIVVADVPLPRPNPMREQAEGSGAGDLIASLLASVTGSEERASEDSDAPQSGEAPVNPPKKTPPASRADLNTIGLRYALKFLDDGDPAAATAAAYALPNRIDTKIIDWLVATSGRDDVPASRIGDVWRRLSDWPGQTLLQIRFEQALVREDLPAAKVIQAMNGRKPATDSGTRLLARAYMKAGQPKDAAALVRAYWREAKFSDDMEASLRKEFSAVLTASDYKTRLDRLLYAEQSAAALRNAKYLDKSEQLLAAAVVAVSDGKASEKPMAAVPAAKRSDPLYIYSKVRLLRRAEKFTDAANLLVSAPRDPKAIDGDAWWVERRLVSRALLDRGNPKLAYKVAASHSAESSAPIAEAEFHAGWYALEYLNDPATARKHFAVIQQVSSMPLSQSRAEYWLGRAAERAGDRNEAAAQYHRAAGYPTTFYGQLALARLGVKKLPLSAPSLLGNDAKQRFETNELVQVIRRLDAANRGDRNDIFYRALAETMTDPAELALLQGMAEGDGNHQLALQVGKTAASRGLPVDTLAFPTAAIPASAKTGAVERPMVYAIARQESAFNAGAVSHAGARGLLQLMPATAKQVSKSVGLPYSQARLTSDPGYNATLGAAHLGDLYDTFGGSYVMTFAAYNAGGSRVRAWVEAYGDPRDPKVDVVNWIERIPFTETRNYVQRIMENLQVYRARLGSPALTIETDLKHGKAG